MNKQLYSFIMYKNNTLKKEFFMTYEPQVITKIQRAALYLDETAITTLLDNIGDANIVLLGEATHGTHEFYELRSEISKRLILEKNFTTITIEGDWPDAYAVNAYIQNNAYNNAQEALQSFDRFPTWMWQNIPMLELVEWLKKYNQQKNNSIYFYGLDLYSLYKSIDAIITTLTKINPEVAKKVKTNYSCLELFRDNPQAYGYYLFSQLTKSCQKEVIEALKNIETIEWEKLKNKISSKDEFFIMQNERVVKNSENYYRSLFINEINNWNLRDTHMMETIKEIIKHHKKNGIKNPKIIIWAHNSHIGNSAATQMSAQGEFNIGHLIKEKFGKQAYSVGFTTYQGTVSAAPEWHMPVERKNIRTALVNSYEDLFHTVGISKFLLSLEDKDIVPKQLLERAIGVIYAPLTERQSHYFYASLAYQFDAVIHFDTTSALEPLEKTTQWIEGEVPETYPSGL